MASAAPGPNIGTRQRDFTMGSGATILLGAVHTPPLKGEPGSEVPPTGIPLRRKETIKEAVLENGNGMAQHEEIGWTNSGPFSPENNGEASSSARTAAPAGPLTKARDGETDSGGETMFRRRRGTTRSSAQAQAPAVALHEREQDDSGDRSKLRSRMNSSKAPRLPVRVTTPLLPSAKGVTRVPASAMYFSPLPFHGHPPGQALRAHTGTLVGGRIWFIGGVDSKTCWRGVAYFDTENLLWSSVEAFGEQLPPLRAHTTSLVGERLYVFGGGDGPIYSNDVWVFDTSKHAGKGRS